MFKKTLISLAVASSVGLTGCFDSGETGANANPDYQIEDTTIDTSIVRPIYDPNPIAAEPEFPINADLILLLGATQSANYDFTGLSTGTTPADDAINRLAGFSTSGAFLLPFDGSLEPATVAANQTVFIRPLNTKDAVEGLPGALPNTNPTSIDPDDPFILDPAQQPNFRAKVVSVDGGTNNAIRIVPLEPFSEYQKYLVIITDNVLGANGKPIERSIQDQNLADGALGNPALANVKTILKTSDDLANGFLANPEVNINANSALAYTFTTTRSQDVLRAMTSPVPYLTELGQKVGFTAQLKAIRDNFPSLNFSQLTDKLAEIADIAADLQSDPSIANDLTSQELMAVTALLEVLAVQDDIPDAISAQVANGNIHIPQPRPSFFFSTRDATDLTTIQGLAASGQPNPIVDAAANVVVSEGAITLPYFQELPGEDGSGITSGSWKGSTSLEKGINDALVGDGNTIFSFLRDIDGRLNVNGYLPFPEQNATVTVPVVVYHPNPASQPPSCGTPAPKNAAGAAGVTIFQHGITVDRSVSMLPGILLANNACQAVVAIDQPLHGLAGAAPGNAPGLQELDADELTATVQAAIDSGTLPAQAEAQLTSLINADYIGERHFNYTANAQLQPTEAPTTSVSSGSLFINPLNMANSTDNLRQGVVDLLNLTTSIQAFSIGGTPNVLAGVPVHFVGHSLGGISGTTFASLIDNATLNGSVNTQLGLPFTVPSLSAVALHNTGGQATRIIENSPAFSGQVLGGLANAGVLQGSSNFESFFYAFQSMVDAADPVSFAKDLGNAATSVAPSNILLTQVVGDNTVPNEADENPLTTALGSALPSPLAGTEPLMALVDLGADGSETTLADGNGVSIVKMGSVAGEGALPAASFFTGANPCSDANHGTFVSPAAPSGCPEGTSTAAAFAEMIRQTALTINGAPVLAPFAGTNPDTSVLGESDTVDVVLDQTQP